MQKIQAKQILSSRSKPDPWFGGKYNMNIYRGCEHRCIYCDSRSECYRIDNFDELHVKENAIELLKDELPRKRKKGTITFGAMSDPYTPSERKLKMTRQALEIIAQHKFPIHLLTKSDMVLRDLDLLKEINEVYCAISFTITTADDELAKRVEPGAPVSSRRFEAMKKLSEAGIYTGITMMPILPFLEDTEENIRKIVEKAVESGAKYIIPWMGMTLRDRQRVYYYKKLDEFFPGMKKMYIKTYGGNYEANSLKAKKLYNLLNDLCKKQKTPLSGGLPALKEQDGVDPDLSGDGVGIPTKMRFYEGEKKPEQMGFRI